MMRFTVSGKWSLPIYRNGVIVIYRLFPVLRLVLGGLSAAFALKNLIEATFCSDNAAVIRTCYHMLLFVGLWIVPLCVLFHHVHDFKKKLMNAYGTTSVDLRFVFYDSFFTVQGPLRTIKFSYADVTYIAETRKYLHLVMDGGATFYSIEKDAKEINRQEFMDYITKAMHIAKTEEGFL